MRGLALHTWTLDSTPLAEALRIARRTGWDAVELRQVDFTRAFEAGQSADDVLDLVQSVGLPVACVGARLGWIWAEGEARRELLDTLADACRWAAALGCDTVMSPADLGTGDVRRAVDSVREAGDLAAEHGVRLAIEPASVAEQLNTVARVRELLSAAGHPHCGLLLDAYHIERSGEGVAVIEELDPSEILYVQYSDLPPGPRDPSVLVDRLPPGRGTVPFREFFALLDRKRYDGYASYEAPNPVTWARDPEEVAHEALTATHTLLS